jgi:hypothetical protein
MKDTLISKERKFTLLVLLVMVMLFLGMNSFLTAKANEAPAPEPVPAECSYRPGLSRDIQYDYITISGYKFIVFRDTVHGGISAVRLY